MRSPPRRPLYRRPLFLAAMISFLLVAGGAFYFVDGNFGRNSSGSVTPVRARSAPENAVIDVVFFDPPEGIGSFRVKAVDAEGADRIDSSDGKEPGTRASNQQSIRFD